MPDNFPINDLTFDERGLIPAIIQDWETGEVLMQAWMNKESLKRTIDTGRTWFWSRSREKLWNKGESSGHFQFVKSIRYDCDQDTILVQVEQRGNACHTGEHTCFYRSLDGNPLKPALYETLDRLYRLIGDRKRLMPAGTYTTSLFEKGPGAIMDKVSEEAAELISAARDGNREEVIYEAADLFYHTGVLLAQSGVTMTEVIRELKGRWK